MKFISTSCLIALLLFTLLLAGCGDDTSTSFTGIQGATGPTGSTGSTGSTGPVNLSSLTVNVTDNNGQPVTGATVTLSHSGIESNEIDTSAAGDYVFNNLTEGQYLLSIEASGYYGSRQTINIPYEGDKITVALTQEQAMVSILGGNFSMGQTDVATPVHDVTLSSFYIGKYEVTNEQFVAFLNAMGNQEEPDGTSWINITDIFFEEEQVKQGIELASGGSEPNGPFEVKEGYENRPVVYLSWYGAVAYCNWLSEQEGLDKCYGEAGNRGKVNITNNGYRLATEAEWEYACRAASITLYYWGSDETNIDTYCWNMNNSDGNHHNVGEKSPNVYGLYDMSGNVWEWCSDWFGSYSGEGQFNPSGPDTSEDGKIMRGGAYNASSYSSYQSANRNYGTPDSRYNNLGFRIVKSNL